MAVNEKPAGAHALATKSDPQPAAAAFRPRGRTIVILGNGPSLSGFDFSRFRDFDVIGMNAAYRYWDQIGWYPRYYICLDDVVGRSHMSAIERLIRERGNGIELFVLRRELVTAMATDVRHDGRIVLFENLRETSPLFAPMPFTTGSHAALVGAWLGYERMLLMGIDCNYVEKIESAENRGANVLRITDTPRRNPNYFFEGYQQKGDQYTVPNPIPDLHLNCWRDVAGVLARNGVTAWNGSSTSRVDFIPFRSFDDVSAEDRAARSRDEDAGHSGTRGGNHYGSGRRSKDDQEETAAIASLLPGSGEVRVVLDSTMDQSARASFQGPGWQVLGPGESAAERIPSKVDVLLVDNLRSFETFPWGRTRPEVVRFRLPHSASEHSHHVFKEIGGFLVGLGYAVYAGWNDPAEQKGHRESRVTKYPAQLPEGLGSVIAFKTDPGSAALDRAFRAHGETESMLATPPGGEQQDERKQQTAAAPSRVSAPVDVIQVSAAGYLAWVRNYVRKYPAVAIGFAVVVLALVAVAALPGAGPYRVLLIGLALALMLAWLQSTGIGYVASLARKVDRRLHRHREATMDAFARDRRQRAETERRLTALSRDVDRIGKRLTNVMRLAQGGKASAARAEAGGKRLTSRLNQAARNLSVLKGEQTRAAASQKADQARLSAQLSENLARTAALMKDENLRSATELKAALGRVESTLSAKITDAARILEDARATAVRAETTGKALQASASTYNFARFRTFNRILSDEHIEILKSVWTRRLSVPGEARSLGYAAHRICTLETNMQGRLATSIEDILLRAMVGRAAGQKSVSVLEIGTLFGIGAIAVVDAVRRDGKETHLTVIDPLEGYYGRAADIVTGQSVSEAIFRDNLRVAGIPDKDVTIIKSMSTDRESIAAAGRSEYDLLIIDGDHSYAGVKGDFDNYAPFVKLGGYVIFDDYNTTDWPDVKQFVDTDMRGHSRFALVGAEWRTAIFRVVKPAEAASPKDAEEAASEAATDG